MAKTVLLELALLLLVSAPPATAAADNNTPAVIFTRAWATSASPATAPPPAWLLVAALLDVQPVVLRVDVRRDAEMQLRSFCHAHGLDASLCGTGLHRALSEVVDLQHVCRQHARTLESPAFVVAKNIIRSGKQAASSAGGEHAPSFSWLQDEAQNIAIDLCRFAKLQGSGETSSCTVALERALQHSFDWINALPTCGQLRERDTERNVQRVDERTKRNSKISAVELMITAQADEPQHLGDESEPQYQQEQRDDIVQHTSEERATGPAQQEFSDNEAPSANIEILSPSMDQADLGISITPVEAASQAESDGASEDDVVSTTETEHFVSTRTDEAIDDSRLHTITGDDDEARRKYQFPWSGHQRDDEERSRTRTSDSETVTPIDHVPVNAKRATEGDNDHITEGPTAASTAAVPDSRTSLEPAKVAPIQTLMLPQPAELHEFGNEAAPELLRVLSTLAMLLFIAHLVVDAAIAGIRAVATSEMVRKCGKRVWMALCAVLSLVLHSDSTLRVSAGVLPSSLKPIKNDLKQCGEVQQHCEPPRSLLRPCSLLISSDTRRSFSQETMHRRAQAIEKVTRAHVRRVQRAAFGRWRLGALQVDPSVGIARRESSSSSSVELRPATSVVIVQTKATASPPSFTCVAMALMFARHGSYHHRVASSRSETKRAESKLSRAVILLFENGRGDDADRSNESYAARRIQLAWRQRHKWRSGSSVSIEATPFSESGPSESTPLLALLHKNRRKQGARQASVGARLAPPTFRGMLKPASPVSLPPCS